MREEYDWEDYRRHIICHPSSVTAVSGIFDWRFFFVFACPAEPPFSALIFIELIAKLNNRERGTRKEEEDSREESCSGVFFFCGDRGDG